MVRRFHLVLRVIQIIHNIKIAKENTHTLIGTVKMKIGTI